MRSTEKLGCLVLWGIFLLSMACGRRSNQESSQLKLTNPLTPVIGIQSVVRVLGVFGSRTQTGTGVFIGPRHILTSAHVFHNQRTGELAEGIHFAAGNLHPMHGVIRDARLRVHDDYHPLSFDLDSLEIDLALLTLDEPEAPSVSRFSQLNPKPGQEVYLAGFGASKLGASPRPGPQALGRNKIHRVFGNWIELKGHSFDTRLGVPPGENSLPAPGDSGSGLFDEEFGLMAVAVCSALDEECLDQYGLALGTSLYTSLHTPTGKARLDELLRAEGTSIKQLTQSVH